MLTTTSIINVRRHVYLYGEIGQPEELEKDLCHWDSEWNYPNEEVVLHINSYGGSIDGMNSILLRLNKVNELYAVVEGNCMSSALIIFQAAKYRAACTSSLFMAHNAVLYQTSRTNEVQVKNLQEYADKVSSLSKNMLTEYLYKRKFINKRELEDIINGNELYIDYNSAVTRGLINFEINNIPTR